MGISFGKSEEQEMMELMMRSTRLSPDRQRQLLRLMHAYQENPKAVV